MGEHNVEFAEFYQVSSDTCLRAVLASVEDRQLAEDLVAEAFVRAWSSWRKVRKHPASAAWVVRTALNTRISWWRRRRGEVPMADYDAATQPDQVPAMDTTPLAGLRRLPARQREVITLRVLLDLDTETTAGGSRDRARNGECPSLPRRDGVSASSPAGHQPAARSTSSGRFEPLRLQAWALMARGVFLEDAAI